LAQILITAITDKVKEKEGAQTSSQLLLDPIPAHCGSQRRRREDLKNLGALKNRKTHQETTGSSGSHHCSSLKIDLASRSS